MDDIQNAIKDHHYAESIRNAEQSPEESLARAITDKLPTPPAECPDILPVDKFRESLKLETLYASKVGRYFLGESLAKIDGSWTCHLEHVRECNDRMFAFFRNATSKNTVHHIADKFKLKSGNWPNASSINEAITAVKSNLDQQDVKMDQVFKPLLDVMVETVFAKGFENMLTEEDALMKFQNILWYLGQEVTENDFLIFRDLGRGAFGVVQGAKHRYTGKMVALKAIDRKLCKGKNALKLVKQEFSILKALGQKPSLFCVSLRYSYFEPTNMILGLPLCTGGDLMFHMRMSPQGYGIARSRFYAAEIMCGLEHLHGLGIIYRDLKPENVLLTDKGHCLISDLGLAVEIGCTPQTRPVNGSKDKTGRAGTPGYWPPSMVKAAEYEFEAEWYTDKYSFDCDWWSWAATLFEFLIGVCPFSESHCNAVGEIQFKDRNDCILRWEIQYPEKCDSESFPEEAKDLLSKMLIRNRSDRTMGMDPDTPKMIRNHPFFRSINWGKLENGTAEVPWTPPANAINAASQDELDSRNNESEFQRVTLTPGEDKIEGFNFASEEHEADIVEVLVLESKGKLDHLNATTRSSACTIL